MPFLLSLLPQGFVNKLDEFIQWLHEAMETTENWTPPKAETDSLRLYLETHLVGKIVLCLGFLSRISMLLFVQVQYQF